MTYSRHVAKTSLIGPRRAPPWAAPRAAMGRSACRRSACGRVAGCPCGGRAARGSRDRRDERIDRATGAFDLPLLIRLRAGVTPAWPGPLGAQPVTEHQFCPRIPRTSIPGTGLNVSRAYPFC